jgi:hypothetical protein
MPLVKRLIKGSTLTYQEMDDNLSFLDNKVSGSNGYITIFSGSNALTSSLLNQIGSTVFVYGSFNVSQSLTVNNSSVVTLASPSYYIATGSVTASVNIQNKLFSLTSASVNFGQIDIVKNNISFGQNTLWSGSIGIYNTAFGYGTLNSNNEGVANTAVGYGALITNTNGDENVAIGGNALSSNITGSNNTAVGSAALDLNVNDDNTALGNSAGLSNTIGTGNTFLGTRAGRLNVTGSYNVFIGLAAGSNEFGSNKLYIANSSTTSPLIKGDFSTGLLQFNTPTATVVTGSFIITGSGRLNNCNILTDCDTGSFLKTTSTGFGNTSYYGSFYHTSSQLTSAPNTPTPVSMSSTDFAYGISISGSNSDKIKFASGGYYDIQFSAQMAKTTGTSATAYFWFRENEIDIPWSNTAVTLAGGSNDLATPAWNYFVSASTNDYVQLMFSATSTNPFITSSLSVGGGPAVPSIIVTVNRVG